MHFRTHPKPESVGQAGRWQSPYHDTMIDHDKVVGALLDKLDELGLAEDTIVIYSTDNGPHMNTWPDGGMTPFRSEKNTNWEGAFRVPEMIRWPGKIPAGVGLERDRPAPRLAADVPRRRGRARHRREAQGRPHDRRHDLQGPHRRLQPAAVPDRRGREVAAQGPRLLLRRRRRARAALRQLEGRLHGAARAGHAADLGRAVRRRCACPSSSTCASTRSSAPTSRRTRTTTGCSTTTTWCWRRRRLVAQFLETFEEFPPRQKAASFTIDQVVDKLEAVLTVGPMSARRPGTTARRGTAILDSSPRDAEAARTSCRRPSASPCRQRRHAVVREADLHAGALHLGGCTSRPRRSELAGSRWSRRCCRRPRAAAGRGLEAIAGVLLAPTPG